MNVVSIMAHQDDEMFCLGTMLKCKARGDALWFVTLTDGSRGFAQRPDISREEAAGIRDQEMSAMAKAAGGSYINLRELDEFLYDTPEVRMNLIEAIRATGADVIFTHYEKDYNLDHITTHLLVKHCAMQSSLPVLPTKSPHLVAHPAIFMVEPHGPIEFNPSHYVDVTDFERRKAEVLSCHVSQEEAMKAALGTGVDEMCAIKSRYRGDLSGCAHAEAFVPMPQRLAIKPYRVLP